MIPFFFHPLTLAYEFGPRHPLRPERLRRAMALFDWAGIESVEPPLALESDLEGLHSPALIRAVREPELHSPEELKAFGLGPGDCPVFPGMYASTMAYCGCAKAAAEAVLDGEDRGYNIAGGLHHARFNRVAGFCIFNDPALAVKVLLRKFERVAYVDIDVHAGEGVMFAYQQDPRVLCCSIHQDPRTLFPGHGHVSDAGPHFNCVNVPLAPEASSDVWLDAFRRGILPALDRFQPQALVLQNGTDAHFADPLARLRVRAEEWLEAVDDLHRLALPAVVLGGGGYNLTTVPRMWLGAVLTYQGRSLPETLPDFAVEWGMPSIFDGPSPYPAGVGVERAEQVLDQLRREVFPRIPAGFRTSSHI